MRFPFRQQVDAIFTRGSQRLIIRGNGTSVDVNNDKSIELMHLVSQELRLEFRKSSIMFVFMLQLNINRHLVQIDIEKL